MELRDIEIFLTLAQELHFGRTAERLHVSVARVSQAIKKQERNIGTELFIRDSRNVWLTPAGEQLRDDLRPIYRGLQETMERARLAASGKTDVLRIGMFPANAHDLRRYWETFRARHPQCGLRIRAAPYTDPFGGLRRGEMDVLVTWFPMEEPDLTAGPVLLVDSRTLAVAVDHELAGRSSVTVEALADFQHIETAARPDYWLDLYTPFSTPKGRPIERGPVVTNAEEVFAMISTGEVIHAFPTHAARYWVRPDITWMPIPDMAALSFGLVWRTAAETDHIRGLAQVVSEIGPLINAE